MFTGSCNRFRDFVSSLERVSRSFPSRSVSSRSGAHPIPSVGGSPKDGRFNGRSPPTTLWAAPERLNVAISGLRSVWYLLIGDCRYDRYWTGRTAWSEVFRNSRTLSRLIWLHVPPILKSGPEGFQDQGAVRTVMAEKVIALDLVQA